MEIDVKSLSQRIKNACLGGASKAEFDELNGIIEQLKSRADFLYGELIAVFGTDKPTALSGVDLSDDILYFAQTLNGQIEKLNGIDLDGQMDVFSVSPSTSVSPETVAYSTARAAAASYLTLVGLLTEQQNSFALLYKKATDQKASKGSESADPLYLVSPERFFDRFYAKHPDARPKHNSEQIQKLLTPDPPKKEQPKKDPPKKEQPKKIAKPKKSIDWSWLTTVWEYICTGASWVVMALPWVLLFAVVVAPLAWCITFGIIIFSHKHQLQVMSSFGGSVAGWVIFSLVAIAVEVVLIYIAFQKESTLFNVISSIVFGVCMSIAFIVAPIKTSYLQSDFDPPSFVTVTYTDFKTDDYGYINAYFDVKNSGPIDVTDMKGKMNFYTVSNGKRELIVEYTMTFNKGFAAGTTNNIYFPLQNKNLIKYNFDLVEADFCITSMTFAGKDEPFEYSREMKTIKPVLTEKPQGVSVSYARTYRDDKNHLVLAVNNATDRDIEKLRLSIDFYDIQSGIKNQIDSYTFTFLSSTVPSGTSKDFTFNFDAYSDSNLYNVDLTYVQIDVSITSVKFAGEPSLCYKLPKETIKEGAIMPPTVEPDPLPVAA